KALLFLAAGSVIHAVGTQDLFKMGGLRKTMRLTAIAFAVGGLALAGIPPFAGFWSKDDILSAVYSQLGSHPAYWPFFLLAFAAVFLTAYYLFRALACGAGLLIFVPGFQSLLLSGAGATGIPPVYGTTDLLISAASVALG